MQTSDKLKSAISLRDNPNYKKWLRFGFIPTSIDFHLEIYQYYKRFLQFGMKKMAARSETAKSFKRSESMVSKIISEFK